MSTATVVVWALGLPLLLTLAGCAVADESPDARVAEIEKMLPQSPGGPGVPASDRATWEKLAQQEAFKAIVVRAEGLLKSPLPPSPDELFLDFTKTGNRTRWQNVAGQRRGRVSTLALAEALEGKGRFLPAFDEVVRALCEERTWVMPAHDGSLANFNGKTVDIDLGSSDLGWQLALAYWLLGDRLSPETRQLIRQNVERRIITPYLDMVAGKRPRNWWMNTTNNWNAVCLAGVTGAGLAMVESRHERARIVAAAELYSRNFLKGFTPDGYCSEGLGYWNYGFGHFVMLSEEIRQATGGKLELIADPAAKMPAQFGARIEIMNGVYPAFADCSVNARPDTATMWYVNRRFGLGLPRYQQLDARNAVGDIAHTLLYAFPNAASETPPAPDATSGPGLRTWFDAAGILICRPAVFRSDNMAVALKGGHNAEHHNHNDVGSYVVVVGHQPVLLDPGAETYTARTFSSRRYESKLLNSFGHPVPVVAGQLQVTGADARAKVLKTEFSDKEDLYQMDITSAYRVKELQSLVRTFVYSREGNGSLSVTDQVQFTSPQSFGTAVLTLGSWEQLSPTHLRAYYVDAAVDVEIDTGGKAFTLKQEEITEQGAHPFRLGIDLTEPVTEATVTLKIRPFVEENTGGSLLKNGGFERGAWGWENLRTPMSELSTERAASGKMSLKITDTDKNAGSNILSGRMDAGPGKYEFRGKIYHESGSGVGIYVRYLDADGNLLNPVDANGNMPAVGTAPGKVGEWTEFKFPFEAPAGTAQLQVWIHSFNAAQVVAYLDDLEIVPVKS
jgi:ribosomal protein L13